MPTYTIHPLFLNKVYSRESEWDRVVYVMLVRAQLC